MGTKSKGGKPTMIARARQEEGSEYMNTIGAAWPFKDGDGLVVKLHMIPTGWDGTFILVKPKDED